ncbi:hypothetical protein TIFTF001_004528 [Ficus carica]|uniref:Uncharacterized protein n=1 Tax=Ficus carica TaxID=3494 RepID=A0AA88CXC3_FICCA|nr:hypothetical protein TIFTF001_004528 [Ficus carica]
MTPMEPPASSRVRCCLLRPPSPTTRSRPIYPPGSRPPPFPLSHVNPLFALPHLNWDLQHQILRPTFRLKMPPQRTSPLRRNLGNTFPPPVRQISTSLTPLVRGFPQPQACDYIQPTSLLFFSF